MYSLKTNRDTRKLKWQYKVRNMPKKRLPATFDTAGRGKVTKGRAGLMWDSVVGMYGRTQEETNIYMMSAESSGRYKTERSRKERRETLALRNKVKSGETLRYTGGLISEGVGMKNVFARSIRENAETALSCGGPGPARKKKEVLVHE